jgi:hypothetical protein
VRLELGQDHLEIIALQGGDQSFVPLQASRRASVAVEVGQGCR